MSQHLDANWLRKYTYTLKLWVKSYTRPQRACLRYRVHTAVTPRHSCLYPGKSGRICMCENVFMPGIPAFHQSLGRSKTIFDSLAFLVSTIWPLQVSPSIIKTALLIFQERHIYEGGALLHRHHFYPRFPFSPFTLSLNFDFIPQEKKKSRRKIPFYFH